MTSTEKAIFDKLVELDNAVRSMPTANPKPNLLPIFADLDTFARSREIDHTLQHYLQRKSYEKARLWLEGREAENTPGNCRH